jgi:hypothetical protein
MTEDEVRDEQLVDELRDVVNRLDPPPRHVLEAAKAAYDWRTLDAELAELVYDSDLDDLELAGVRGESGPQILSFEAPALTIDVEIGVDPGGRRRLIGQLAPPQPARVEVRAPGGTTTTDTDELGRLAVEGLEPGPVSLSCHLRSGAVVVTEWTVV